MNLSEQKESWDLTKGKLKNKFTLLTDIDLLLENGKVDEIIGRLQSKLGKTKEEILKLISEL